MKSIFELVKPNREDFFDVPKSHYRDPETQTPSNGRKAMNRDQPSADNRPRARLTLHRGRRGYRKVDIRLVNQTGRNNLSQKSQPGIDRAMLSN